MTMRYRGRAFREAIIGIMEHTTYTIAQRDMLHPTADDEGQRIIVIGRNELYTIQVWDGSAWQVEYNHV